MFNSGFAESAAELDSLADTSQADDASVSDVGAFAQQFDDSDYEDDEDSMAMDNDFPSDETDPQETLVTEDEQRRPETSIAVTSNKRQSVSDDEVLEYSEQSGIDNADEQDQSARNTRQKVSHPSTPRSRELALEQRETQLRSPPPPPLEPPQRDTEALGPRKARVVVRDVAYATYRAVLYYVSSS